MTMAWVECKFAEIPAGLGATPMPHNGRWYAMDGNRPLRWAGTGAYEDRGDPNDPNSTAYADDWRARAWGYDTTPTPAAQMQPQQSQSDIQYDRDWRARAWGYSGPPGTGHPIGAGAMTAIPNPMNRAEINAAQDLLAYFNVNPCSQASLPVVTAFQNAYNASGLPGKLTMDGQYGGNTQKALQNVMDEAQADAGAGPSQQAPTNCFGMTVPATPALDPTPAPGGNTPVPSIAPITVYGTPGHNPWLIAGAIALGAAGIAYAVHLKKKRRRVLA